MSAFPPPDSKELGKEDIAHRQIVLFCLHNYYIDEESNFPVKQIYTKFIKIRIIKCDSCIHHRQITCIS